MRRFEAIQRIMEAVTNEIVVGNIGHPAQELYAIKDRPENFYMLGSMGLASSIGLGLALSTDRKVVVLDGDGAVLMNLGSIATIGALQPKNLVLIIIDNEAYGSTGFQATFTTAGIHLERIARACNIEKTALIVKEEEISPALKKILAADDGPSCLVIKVEKGMPAAVAVIPYDATYLRDRFMKSIAQGSRAEAQGWSDR